MEGRNDEDHSLSSVEERRCKRCSTIIVGDRAARVAHSMVCPGKHHIHGELASQSAAANTTSVIVPHPSTHKEELQLVSRTICRFCGKHHDSESCLLHMPSGYRERLRQTNTERSSTNKIKHTERKCITPDLERFDKGMDALLQRVVPAPLPNKASWKRCPHCNKRVVDAVLKLHVAQTCVVKSISQRLDLLKRLCGCQPSHQEDDETGNADEEKDNSETLQLHPALQSFPESVRVHEQILLLVGILNAVAPINDLFPDGNATPFTVRTVMNTIETRVHSWVEGVRNRDAAVSPSVDPELEQAWHGGNQVRDVGSAPQGSPSISTELSVARVLHAPAFTQTGAGKYKTRNGDTTHKGDPPQEKTFDRETMSIAKKMNRGKIVSLDDERRKEEFESARSSSRAHSTANSSRGPSSRVNSATPSRLPPLGPRKTSASSPANPETDGRL